MEQVSSAALQTWVRLLRGHAATTRALSADLYAEHGLTINDYEALLLLSRADGNAMKRVDLANDLLLTPSGVTRLLAGLEEAGCVEKGACATDARITYAVLTDTGREKLHEASRSHLEAVRTLFERRYSEDELATLGELLSRLPGAAQADAGDCSPPD